MQNEIFITQGQRPWWQRLVAALSFTFLAFCVFNFFREMYLEGMMDGSWMKIAALLGVIAFRMSIVKNYYFDFENRKYKLESTVGPFRHGKWKDFQNLEYISVFKNEGGIVAVFEINLWYNRNKHFNIAVQDDLENALTLGGQLAKKLKIDLLDAATDPKNSEWIEF